MFFKKKLISTISPSLYLKKTVNFGKNIEFTLIPEFLSDDTFVFHLVNPKGDFEILKITVKCLNTINGMISQELPYNKETKLFKFRNYQYYNNVTFEFEILATIEYRKVDYVEDTYVLHFPSRRLKMLDEYEFEEVEIVLPKYSHLYFMCYFKKHEEGAVEVHIVNPYAYDVKIQGKKGDFIYETNDNEDINLRLHFLFNSLPPIAEEHEFEVVESRPESALPEYFPK